MDTLDTYIAARYGEPEAQAARDFFENLDLPLPFGYDGDRYNPGTNSEFCATYGGGYIVFLNDKGCVVRITDNQKYPLLEHPRILQPLASRVTPKLRLEIYPGLRNLKDWKDYSHPGINSARECLDEDGIDFWDAAPRNCGTLPTSDSLLVSLIKKMRLPYIARKLRASEYTIVLDADAVRKLSDSVKAVKQELEGVKNPQDTLFGHLKRAFSEAWPQDAAKADPAKIRNFWQECRESCERGILIAGWLKAKDFKKYSSNYATRQKTSSAPAQAHCAL